MILAFICLWLAAEPVGRACLRLPVARTAACAHLVVVIAGECVWISSLLVAHRVDEVLPKLLIQFIYCVVRKVLRQDRRYAIRASQLLDHSALVGMYRQRHLIVLLRHLNGVHVHGVGPGTAKICLLAVGSLVYECICLVLGLVHAESLLVAVSLLDQFACFARKDLLGARLLDVGLGCPCCCDEVVAVVGRLVKVTLTIELRLGELKVHVSPAVLAVGVHGALV